MRACPKCGRGVEDSWSVCMACGTSLQPAAAAAPAGAAGGGQAVASAAAAGGPAGGGQAVPAAAPPVAPPAGVFAASPPPPAPGDFEIPRYQGGTAPAGKPGFKSWILIVILLVVIAAAGTIYFGWEKDEGGTTGPGGQPQGTVDRAKAGVRQMGSELKDELKDEWRELDRDPEEKAPAP